MRSLNEEEWKKLQEIVKKIDEEQTIGVDFYAVSFTITKDGIKNISGGRVYERIKHEKTNGMISPPSKPKKKRSLMEELEQMFLNREDELNEDTNFFYICIFVFAIILFVVMLHLA